MVLYILLLSLLLVVWVYKLNPLRLYNYAKKSNTLGLSFFAFHRNFSQRDELARKFLSENHIKGFWHAWIGPRFTLLAADPDAAQFVLKCPDIEKANISARKIVNDHLGDHVVRANGDDWRKQRSFLNSGFSQNAYKEYFSTFNQVMDKVFTKWTQFENNGDFEYSPWLYKFTLDLLGQSVFHYDFGLLDGKLSEHYEAYETVINSSSYTSSLIYMFFPFLENLPLIGAKKMQTSVDTIYSLFSNIISEHKEKPHNDILDHLLQGTEETHQLSTKELYSNIWILFLAGHETTARALVSAIAELADQPQIQEKLYQVIQTTWGNEMPSYESIAKPPEYLQAFIDENLRKHPPAPALPSRAALKDINYGDQVIPAGAQVAIDITSIHHHPEHWENPDVFDPDRFLPENKKGRHRFAFLPFSLGSRQCIGNEFSEIEQRLFIVRMLQRWKILTPKNHPQANQKRMWFVRPTTPLSIQLEKR